MRHFTTDDITACVLAGGQGTRMGGVDKGLQDFQGQPLARHALQRIGLQVGQVMLNANRNLPTYKAFGVPVWPDELAGYAGPLAGFLAGLAHCSTSLLLSVPCDSPLFPVDLAQRLLDGLQAEEAEMAMAWAPEADSVGPAQLLAQPVFCLMHTTLLPSLLHFTQAGGRKINHWAAQHRCAAVAFDGAHDDPNAFANANDAEELRRLQGLS